MKVIQIRTVENVHMGIDLTKNILSGDQPSAKHRGIRMETCDIGVRITFGAQQSYVPWSNIIVANVDTQEAKA